MTIAWFIFASVGMLTARYGKGIEKKLLGKNFKKIQYVKYVIPLLFWKLSYPKLKIITQPINI